MDKERTTQEGQVTYPVLTGRPGYLPALAHISMHVAFLSLSFDTAFYIGKVQHLDYTTKAEPCV